MSDIFISYKHAQRREARQLASALAARGWTVWWDWNIPTRAEWQAELDAQLDAAGCVVVLWSAESLRSEWVLYEARFAQRAGKLIQALLEPLQPPAEFASFQGVDLAGWEFGAPFHAGFDQLRAAIRDLLDRRAPVASSRSGPMTRIPGEAGDALRRDKSEPPTSRARPAPVMLLPPPFRDLLDRRDENATISETLAQRRNVALGGAIGSGKTALLSYVGNLDHTARFHDGVVYLQAATLGENDLAQALHEAFYDVPAGVRPSAVEMRRHLADKTALLLVDDVELPPSALQTVNGYGPQSVWVFASEVAAAGAQRRPVALKGLPADDGIALFERTLSRPLRAEERGTVARIVDSLQGHPARIELAAGTAAAHGVAAALAELAKATRLDEEDPQSRRVLAALACAGAVPLEAEQCAAISGVSDVGGVLADLLRRGLVQNVEPGFRLAAGLAAQVEATAEFVACRDRAPAVFASFAFQARGTPRRVARLAAPMMASMAWAAEHGRSADALRLARAIDGPLADANRWDAWRDMLARAHDIATRAGDLSNAGWAQHQQGTRSALLEHKKEARRLFRAARSTRKRIGDTAGFKVTAGNLKLLGWAPWMVLLAVVAGLGATTLGALVVAPRIMGPKVALVPGSLDFGAQDVRAAAQQQALRIDNKGFGPVGVVDVTVQGRDARSFSVGNSCDGIEIPRRLACRLLVQFKPEDAGAHDATIAIRVRGVAEPFPVPLRGVGTATPVVELLPQPVDFGAVEIGGAAETRRVMLRNTGSGALTVTAIAVDGDGDFRIAGDSCRAAPMVPEATCAIDLRFAPRDAATKRATLVVSDNASGSPQKVALTGEGHATLRLEALPGNLDFGRQEIGTQSGAQQVRLRNAGNAKLGIRQVTLEGSKAFRLQGNCSDQNLDPGAGCVLDLRFAPSVIEASRARLVIVSSGGDRSVGLSGEGIGRPAIEVTPGQVDFGNVKPDAGVKPRRVTVASVGSDAVLLRAPSIEGDGRFSLTNGCPARLAPTARCFVDVEFEPSGAGTARARLVVAHNAAGGPATVSLSAEIGAIPPPVIERFDSSPQALPEPRNVELCFRARNATRLTIDQGASQPQSNSDGCVSRFVRTTTTFTLTASGEGGSSRQASTTVTVAAAPPPPPPPPTPEGPIILDFRANPAVLKGPGESRLCFAAQNAERAVIEPGGAQPVLANGGCVARSVSRTTTFVLTVSRRNAAPRQRTATVTVAGAPPPPPSPEPPVIVRLGAAPAQLKGPGETRVCFVVRNAERVVIEPGEPQPPSATEGCVVRAVSKTMQFRVTASRKGAPPAQRDVTVTVVVPDVPKGTRDGPLTTGPAKGGVVDKFKPGAVEAIERPGYCCVAGNVKPARRAACSAMGGRYFTAPPSKEACPQPGPVIK